MGAPLEGYIVGGESVDTVDDDGCSGDVRKLHRV